MNIDYVCEHLPGKKTFLYKSDKFHNKKKVFEKNIFIELYQIQWPTYNTTLTVISKY